MAISFYFVNKGFTPDKYGEAIRQLEPAGAGARRTHLSRGSGDER
jgi:hypothetical protein